MVTRLNIDNTVLTFYIEQSHAPIEQIKERVHNIELFISGEKQPTFNQLVKISKIINIPTGLLLLNKKINTQDSRLEYRTINSKSIDQNGISPELRDTINEMEIKQDFLKNELDSKLDYIGKYSIKDDHLYLAEIVRKKIGLGSNHFSDKKFKSHPLNFFRTKINNVGVFVFLNGKVKDNTHRPLNIKEFRGFVLSDQTAPLIFINQTDSRTGQLFTLIHELVHLFIGVEGIFNLQDNDYDSSKTEAYVNKVTAEILVPANDIQQMNSLDITDLANKFRVSKFVIARRLLDTENISYSEYATILETLQKEFEDSEKKSSQKNSSGGDYNNNLKFRMDNHFFYHVENALNQNRISYTEAFDVLGVGYKGFKTLQEATR